MGQGTLSPVIPLAYGMKVCVRAYSASALQFLNIFAVGFSSLSAVGGVLQGFTPVGVPCEKSIRIINTFIYCYLPELLTFVP